MGLWDRIVRYLSAEERLALVTVLEAQGSTPREPGARMIVLPNGRISGTIGGGALEWQALGAAESALARPDPSYEVRPFALGPELGQCCGGRVSVAIEVLDKGDLGQAKTFARHEAEGQLVTLGRRTGDGRLARSVASSPDESPIGSAVYWTPDGALLERFGDQQTAVVLFGAGHVGRAVVLALAPLPFKVTWVDQRKDAFPDRVPENARVFRMDDPGEILDRSPDGAFILVMTHSHPLDLALTARALSAGRFPYVGLIGSHTKRTRFVRRLEEIGLPEAALGRLVCPIGILEIRSKLPAAIAVGVAAELLIRHERLASEQVPTTEPGLPSRVAGEANG